VGTASRPDPDAMIGGVALALVLPVALAVSIGAEFGFDIDVVNFIDVVIEEIEVVVGIGETWAPECLPEAGRASFHATAGVMDAARRSEAIPTGEVDHPLLAVFFVPPTDRLEQLATDL
jgi:hypothetical protein